MDTVGRRAARLGGGSEGDSERHAHVSTRCGSGKRIDGPESASARAGRGLDLAEEVAIVACAKRDLLLRVHRHRLRREDLEDCDSQAILELVAHARGDGVFADRGHIAHAIAQDYVHWGLSGPGRWVTIYSTTSPTDHTFMTIAGLRLDTSHNSTDIGPNAAEDGPRWRVLDHIPTWAHWSVRHPPGL
jgi:hypothetical protein